MPFFLLTSDIAAWTPLVLPCPSSLLNTNNLLSNRYGIVSLIGAFGNRSILTPVATMIPAVAAKIVSCLDPWVYAISHPRYRQALEQRVPWLGIREKMNEVDNKSAVTTDASA